MTGDQIKFKLVVSKILMKAVEELLERARQMAESGILLTIPEIREVLEKEFDQMKGAVEFASDLTMKGDGKKIMEAGGIDKYLENLGKEDSSPLPKGRRDDFRPKSSPYNND